MIKLLQSGSYLTIANETATFWSLVKTDKDGEAMVAALFEGVLRHDPEYAEMLVTTAPREMTHESI